MSFKIDTRPGTVAPSGKRVAPAPWSASARGSTGRGCRERWLRSSPPTPSPQRRFTRLPRRPYRPCHRGQRESIEERGS